MTHAGLPGPGRTSATTTGRLSWTTFRNASTNRSVSVWWMMTLRRLRTRRPSRWRTSGSCSALTLPQETAGGGQGGQGVGN